MAFEIEGVRIALLSELSKSELDVVRDFFVTRGKSRLLDFRQADFDTYVKSKEVVAFCAFLGDKVVGIAPMQKKGKCLEDRYKVRAITPKSFILKSRKTIGRVLYEAINEYANRTGLSVRFPYGSKSSGAKYVGRMLSKRADKPKPVTQRASWKSRKR
jgi:hypothetical protein